MLLRHSPLRPSVVPADCRAASLSNPSKSGLPVTISYSFFSVKFDELSLAIEVATDDEVGGALLSPVRNTLTLTFSQLAKRDNDLNVASNHSSDSGVMTIYQSWGSCLR